MPDHVHCMTRSIAIACTESPLACHQKRTSAQEAGWHNERMERRLARLHAEARNAADEVTAQRGRTCKSQLLPLAYGSADSELRTSWLSFTTIIRRLPDGGKNAQPNSDATLV